MDLKILDFIQTFRNPILDQFFKLFTSLGDHGEIWIFLILLIYLKRKDKKLVIYSLIVLLSAVFIVEILIKPIVQRPRPFIINPQMDLLLQPRGYSFPSGHTTTSVALVTFLLLNDVSYKYIYIPTAILMGFSRLYLYVHYPTDVLIGILLGAIIGIVVYIGMKKHENIKQIE